MVSMKFFLWTVVKNSIITVGTATKIAAIMPWNFADQRVLPSETTRIVAGATALVFIALLIVRVQVREGLSPVTHTHPRRALTRWPVQ